MTNNTSRERYLAGLPYNHAQLLSDTVHEEALFKEGVLRVDSKVYAEEAVRQVSLKLTEVKKGRKRLTKEANQEVQAFYDYQAAMCGWVEKFQGKVPASWLDPQRMVEAYRQAGIERLLLSDRLINPGLVHPNLEVRTALWEHQPISSAQMAILACYGVETADRESQHRAHAMAVLSAPYLPMALNEVFGIAVKGIHRTRGEKYHTDREQALGLPVGTGKRYNRNDILRFIRHSQKR